MDYFNRERLEKARGLAYIISQEAIQRLDSRKVKDLSLEESLNLKELVDVGVMGVYDPPQGVSPIRQLMHELNDHIDTLYKIKSAPDLVDALKVASKHRNKLYTQIEELRELCETSSQNISRIKSTRLSFGENMEKRQSIIKSYDESGKMMIEELEQKIKEKELVEAEIQELENKINEKKEEYLTLHKPPERISWQDKAMAWGIVKNAQLSKERRVNIMERISGMGKNRRRTRNQLNAQWAKTGGVSAISWAERMQGVVLAPPPPHLSPLPLSIYNTVEGKALRALNAKDSGIAAQAIFPNKPGVNKPKWGIPYVGPGFGGRKTRKRKQLRKRIKSYRK